MTNCQIIPERCPYNIKRGIPQYLCTNGIPCQPELARSEKPVFIPVVAENATIEKQVEKPVKTKRNHSNAGIKARWEKAKSLGFTKLSQLTAYEMECEKSLTDEES
jgi:hypothetical protein